MSNLKKLVKNFISGEHGDAVAEQFVNTFDGESFEEQNGNALRRIHACVHYLLGSNLLSDDAFDLLEVYLTDLKDYLAEQN